MNEESINVSTTGSVRLIEINRPHSRNALDAQAVIALKSAFDDFGKDEHVDVAVLSGRDGFFCAGADLKEVAERPAYKAWAGNLEGMLGAPLNKPLIGAVEGHAVAGGLGVALFCDVRIVSETAVFGVFCRRFGVPMSDGTTVRLPRLIGQSRALDIMLTGRAVDAHEALAIGLAAQVVPAGQAQTAAIDYAKKLAQFPQRALRSDRLSLLRQTGLDLETALVQEAQLAAEAKATEAQVGAARFASGSGRHGDSAPD